MHWVTVTTPRLHRVLVPDAGDSALDELRCELAVLGRDGQQLDAGDRLRSAALVDVHVRRLGADHRLPRATHGAQRQHVRRAAGEHEERARARPEVLGEHRFDERRVVVVPVSERVADVDTRDRREDVGMDRGRVV